MKYRIIASLVLVAALLAVVHLSTPDTPTAVSPSPVGIDDSAFKSFKQ